MASEYSKALLTRSKNPAGNDICGGPEQTMTFYPHLVAGDLGRRCVQTALVEASFHYPLGPVTPDLSVLKVMRPDCGTEFTLNPSLVTPTWQYILVQTPGPPIIDGSHNSC
jgi:hypothetical protein